MKSLSIQNYMQPVGLWRNHQSSSPSYFVTSSRCTICHLASLSTNDVTTLHCQLLHWCRGNVTSVKLAQCTHQISFSTDVTQIQDITYQISDIFKYYEKFVQSETFWAMDKLQVSYLVIYLRLKYYGWLGNVCLPPHFKNCDKFCQIVESPGGRFF